MFSKDLGCLKTIKVDRNNLSSTKWQNGLMFVWESHHAGGCWSAVGRVPGFIDSEYTSFQSILETGAPSGWQVVGFGTDCGGDTGMSITCTFVYSLVHITCDLFSRSRIVLFSEHED